MSIPYIWAAIGSVGIGVMVGATSIGGFLLVPLLMIALDLPIAEAVTTALLVFVLSGVVGVYLYRRRMDARLAVGLALAALPGIWAGLRLSRWMSEQAAEVSLSCLLIALAAYVGRSSVGKRSEGRRSVGGRSVGSRFEGETPAVAHGSAPATAPAPVQAGVPPDQRPDRLPSRLPDRVPDQHPDQSLPRATAQAAASAAPGGGEPAAWRTPRGRAALVVASVAAGAATNLAGVGGALVLVPVMVSLGMVPAVAVGTGMLYSWVMSFLASAGRLADSPVSPALVALILVSYAAGLFLGEAVVRRQSGPGMRRLIVVLCLVSSVAVLF